MPPNADLPGLFHELVGTGNVFFISHPGLLAAEIRRDPELSRHFTVRYPLGPWLWQNGPNIRYLVYYESTPSIYSALEREKQIKGWLRAKKIALIESSNPGWKDLSEEWYTG